MFAIAFARLTQYVYRLNLLEREWQILANRYTDALGVKGSEKETQREKKINAPLAQSGDAMQREAGKKR